MKKVLMFLLVSSLSYSECRLTNGVIKTLSDGDRTLQHKIKFNKEQRLLLKKKGYKLVKNGDYSVSSVEEIINIGDYDLSLEDAAFSPSFNDDLVLKYGNKSKQYVYELPYRGDISSDVDSDLQLSYMLNAVSANIPRCAVLKKKTVNVVTTNCENENRKIQIVSTLDSGKDKKLYLVEERNNKITVEQIYFAQKNEGSIYKVFTLNDTKELDVDLFAIGNKVLSNSNSDYEEKSSLYIKSSNSTEGLNCSIGSNSDSLIEKFTVLELN